MKLEIWKCVDCGKEIYIDKSSKELAKQLWKRCDCDGFWKFKK